MSIRKSALYPALLFLALMGFDQAADADFRDPSAGLAVEIVSETVPNAFPPVPWDGSEFQLRSVGDLPPKVEAHIVTGSLQWVRVSEVLVLPRGRVVISAAGYEAGLVTSAGGSQTMVPLAGQLTAEMPVALISNPKNTIELSLKRGVMVFKAKLFVEFHSLKGKFPNSIFFDPSCSSFGLDSVSVKIPDTQWVYVGCRFSHVFSESSRTSSLELLIFWNGVGQSVLIDENELSANGQSFWVLRMRSAPGKVRLRSLDSKSQFGLLYRIPEELHLATLGFGIGPYAYHFDAPGASVNQWVPIATAYASYFVSETVRLVAFDATTIHRVFYTDFGTYLNYESTRALDQRVSLNFMLGVHFLWFRAFEQTNFKFGGPQGVELIWRDAFLRTYNASAGAFVYPMIDGKSYYNAWIRYGNSRFFTEFNFISWEERLERGQVSSRSLGISAGFPIAKFF